MCFVVFSLALCGNYENYSISLDKYLEQYNDLKNRHLALAEQFNKKNEVIKSIEEQGKLTDELLVQIGTAKTLAEVEDLYRPYKQKKKTKASG